MRHLNSSLIRRPSAVLTGLVALALTSCASAPSAVRNATDLRIGYWDFRTDQEMFLVDDSNPEFADLYSSPQDSAAIKRAPHEMLVDLVEHAGSSGFFDHTDSLAGPDEIIRATAFRMIVISADGQNYSLYLEDGLADRNMDAVLAFDKVQREISSAYNSIFQLQAVRSTSSGKSYFQKEQERLIQENKETLSRGKELGN